MLQMIKTASVYSCLHLPDPMEHESNEKDDKEVMGEPEHLKIGPANDLHGGGNDEDEGEGDHDACYSCDRGEHGNGLAL
ncbi:uncharacterized [Tachysurus ichikawai]